MVIVCAWCERYLGSKPSKHGGVTHGICGTCQARQRWRDTPTFILEPGRAELLPVIKDLLRGKPEIPVVVDRRLEERRGGERRRAGLDTRGVHGRRKLDRRRAPAVRIS